MRVSQETSMPLLDVAALIADQSMDKIPGNDWYLDHVHPNIGAHQLIARALAARIRDLHLLTDLREWIAAERQSAYTVQMTRLGHGYLAEGLHRVQWLEH